jgi:signal transduction histidine kinase
MFTPVLERDGGTVVWEDLCGSTNVAVDRGALAQALVAVLDNARKYGGAPPRVQVTTRRDGARVAIDVRDHGPGVPVAEREHVFARFVRGSAHAHGSTPGVGIGLYLARTIARALRGDLVCGEPLDGGRGARFTFSLPSETAA